MNGVTVVMQFGGVSRIVSQESGLRWARSRASWRSSAKRASRRPVRNGCQGLARIRPQDARGQAPRAGRALHGLRNPLLPQGLPARQHHSRLERSGLPRALARGDRPAALDQQLSRIYRPRLSRALRRSLRPQYQQRSGHDQADRKEHHRSCLGRRLGHAAAEPAQDRQERRGGRLGPFRDWPARSNWRAPATRHPVSSAPTASAVC